MNFNVYLDDETAKRVEELARATGETRNAIVRRAISSLLQSNVQRWPDEVRGFQGDPSFMPFEQHRAGMRAAVMDPFGLTKTPHSRRLRSRRRRGK